MPLPVDQGPWSGCRQLQHGWVGGSWRGQLAPWLPPCPLSPCPPPHPQELYLVSDPEEPEQLEI